MTCAERDCTSLGHRPLPVGTPRLVLDQPALLSVACALQAGPGRLARPKYVSEAPSRCSWHFQSACRSACGGFARDGDGLCLLLLSPPLDGSSSAVWGDEELLSDSVAHTHAVSIASASASVVHEPSPSSGSAGQDGWSACSPSRRSRHGSEQPHRGLVMLDVLLGEACRLEGFGRDMSRARGALEQAVRADPPGRRLLAPPTRAPRSWAPTGRSRQAAV